MTYTELVQKIRDYTEVTSTVLTDTIVNGFIENAEFRILRDVDSDNNRRYVTAQMVASLTLPGDFAFQDLSNSSMVPEDPSVINGRRQAQINVGEVTVSIT